MERIQAAVLALLIAALVLFGLGYVVDDAPLLARYRGPGGDERERIALWNSERETRRRGVPAPAGDEAREGRRRRGASLDDDDGRLARDGFTVDGLIGAGGRPRRIAPDLVAARSGLLPAGPPARARGGDGGAPPPPMEEPAEPEETDPELLLSVPFDGSLVGENGDAATQAEGVLFNGDAIEFTNEARVVFPSEGNVNSAAGTISFEITPRWAGSDPTNNSFLQIRDQDVWENSLQIVKNLGTLRFIIVDDRGLETDINVPITDWQPSEPHVVTATWDRGEMALYIDRRWVGANQRQNGLLFAATTPLQVGSVGANYGGAGGQIRNLTIHGSAFSGERIASR